MVFCHLFFTAQFSPSSSSFSVTLSSASFSYQSSGKIQDMLNSNRHTSAIHGPYSSSARCSPSRFINSSIQGSWVWTGSTYPSRTQRRSIRSSTFWTPWTSCSHCYQWYWSMCMVLRSTAGEASSTWCSSRLWSSRSPLLQCSCLSFALTRHSTPTLMITAKWRTTQKTSKL